MNQAGRLQRALMGLARQTDRGFSVVVVNDGSTDDTESRVAGLALPFAVTLVSVPNGGPAQARNLGIAVADDREEAAVPSGIRWIAFLDDDVVPTEGWMAAIKAAAADSSAEVLVGKTTTTTLGVPSVFSHQLTVLTKPPGPFPPATWRCAGTCSTDTVALTAIFRTPPMRTRTGPSTCGEVGSIRCLSRTWPWTTRRGRQA